ncbi:MAG TPA: penicillin-binding transpeptidase domain-containing protein [Xanthomonadales bacterium]|nr:penicillin-binding transpeptidase domain-containing protein [Xanthomonadales bacterium]
MKTGFAFGEHIKTEKIKKRRYSSGPLQLRLRGVIFPIVLIVAGAVLFFKLFQLQIVKGAEYKILSDSNRIRTQIIHAPRGVIFDRFGVPLVQNAPGFRKIINEKETKLLSREEALTLLAKGEKNLEIDTHREYPYKDGMSHVLGYIGQISKEQLNSTEFADYNGTDWVGKSGIEREYEHILKGTDGKQLIEVDVMGKKVRSLGTTDPVPGQDISLTIDARIQKATHDATKNVKRGAVIVSTPDGEILALISRPSFDPNLFTRDGTYKTATDSAYQKTTDIINDSKTQPLLDRAISGIYPPGSTFKLVTAAAGLNDNTIDENYRIKDTGIIRVGEFSFANWYHTNYGRTEPGELDVTRALSRSNDIFFYKLAEKVRVDKLSKMAEKMGLGAKTGIDLGGEEEGLVPNPAWKKKQIGESWYLGDTYHYGIGQGYVLTTPLQVNMFATIIANGGSLYEPHLLKNQKSKIKNQNLLNEKTVSLIRQGMIDSCTQTIGVAWPLFNLKIKNQKLKIDGKNFLEVKEGSGSASLNDQREIPVACKTGTAQHGGEETLPHAWITLFAPAYNPEIVVTVLNEESGEGSNEAAPIAKKILEAYFTK